MLARNANGTEPGLCPWLQASSGQYFELLDRTLIASSYVQNGSGDHPTLIRNPEFKYEGGAQRIKST